MENKELSIDEFQKAYIAPAFAALRREQKKLEFLWFKENLAGLTIEQLNELSAEIRKARKRLKYENQFTTKQGE